MSFSFTVKLINIYQNTASRKNETATASDFNSLLSLKQHARRQSCSKKSLHISYFHLFDWNVNFLLRFCVCWDGWCLTIAHQNWRADSRRNCWRRGRDKAEPKKRRRALGLGMLPAARALLCHGWHRAAGQKARHSQSAASASSAKERCSVPHD